MNSSIGLGLFIVRAIARAHGGGVSVCSGELTTTFTVVFAPARPWSSTARTTKAPGRGDQKSGIPVRVRPTSSASTNQKSSRASASVSAMSGSCGS